ncbi:hypothetical protein SBF1_110023 [Candidatus Desulfosporosinus infrequens]|uniref:Uncharacterized protein n=1 Tax=Candidatus Desulfosporosinus infrequens TaxID=2043169 RepID=A0A2U3JX61_9FIRM|nr:hypothetical protein SBF1_110023 [Candidatus Desulfosporosinus infrequens]
MEKTVVDMAGRRSVTLPQDVKKVITTGSNPMLFSLIVALGEGDTSKRAIS